MAAESDDQTARVREIARAKINLFLHITGQRSDGYHLLESLVAFAEIGDSLEAEFSPASLSLTLDGPFAATLSAGPENLVLRAAELLRKEAGIVDGAAIRLVKSLPIASGIGGGSADAAAALRALNQLWRLDWPMARLEAVGAQLGADVPVCLRSETRMMRGVGDRLSSGPAMPPLGIVLANPLKPVETRAVFAAREGAFSHSRVVRARFADTGAFIRWLERETSNDLAAAAKFLRPEIAHVEQALRDLPAARLARMSGSGATCFGLFDTSADAAQAAEILRAAHSNWWIEAAALTATASEVSE